MGIVYLAERKEPVVQRVALKVIRTGMLDDAYRARFAMEQQALARMDHPNVARLLDAGDDDGQSWFAMEYVPGQPLSEYCRDHRLSLEQRLRLFGQVCNGVQHAHMKGILHRDLKPGNIMVREVDGHAIAKIIDFGLAQPLDPLQVRASLHEAMRQIVGTLAYMSPEQAARNEGDLDTRTDVFSLGVVLYELLTGELPLDMDAIEREGIAAFAKYLRGHEPKKPSTRLHALGDRLVATAAECGLSPQRLRSLVRGDLDWVTMKALARDRQHRYLSVGDLGKEIERYLARRPVEAGPPTTWYVLSKWLQRHRVATSVASILVVTIVLVVSVLQSFAASAREADRRRAILDRSAVIAEHMQRADELWPANAQQVASIQEWLVEAQRLQALGSEVESLAALLTDEHDQAGAPAKDRIAEAAFREQVRTLESRRAMATQLHNMMPVVQARLDAAQTLRQRTVDAHQASWDAAIEAVANDERFADFELQAVPGLVPLGSNATSGLQEFYLLASAGEEALPVRDPDGGFDVGAMTGMVFTLIPGGKISLQLEDAPRWQVTVLPFLVSRYEMTQAQWARLGGEGLHEPGALDYYNPSNVPNGLQREPNGPAHAQPDAYTLTWQSVHWSHPVQQLSWLKATELLPRWSLDLPSSAEWLHAANGPDWQSALMAWLPQAPTSAANLRGSGDANNPGDGFVWTVGSLAPNPWGLHDVIGNVTELCRDGYADGEPGNRVADARRGQRAVVYGMSFLSTWARDRLPGMGQIPTQNLSASVGLRPVLRLPATR